jgi:GNAT superfamily N-acetyltransferase
MLKDKLVIRSASHSDRPAILELVAQNPFSPSPEPTVPDQHHLSAFDTIAAHADHEIVVGTIDDQVIATLQLSFIPGLSHQGAWRAQVEAVRVHRNFQKLGIGTAMMQWVIVRARERGCWLVQLTTNWARAGAIRFYERLGFEASHVGMKLHL